MDKVRGWLTSVSLEQYGDILEENGWDDMETVCTMSAQDIQELVSKPGHVRKLTIAIKSLNEQREQFKETLTDNASSPTNTQNINSDSAYKE